MDFELLIDDLKSDQISAVGFLADTTSAGALFKGRDVDDERSVGRSIPGRNQRVLAAIRSGGAVGGGPDADSQSQYPPSGMVAVSQSIALRHGQRHPQNGH